MPYLHTRVLLNSRLLTAALHSALLAELAELTPLEGIWPDGTEYAFHHSVIHKLQNRELSQHLLERLAII